MGRTEEDEADDAWTEFGADGPYDPRDYEEKPTMQTDLLILRQLVAEHAGNDGFAAYERVHEALARTEKTDAATIKAIIWKHWNNKNGQTLEERFTSTANEIAQALAKINAVMAGGE
jgi:hypothetical protein